MIIILYLKMVKNITGGSKAKGQARKFVSNKQTKFLRVSENDYELYAQVIKILGNGMCHVLCIDNMTRLCHIRGKFRGRGKRDNTVTNSSWILVGIRDWESTKKDNEKLENCDLLEVYDDYDKERLKNTINNINWNLFNNDNYSNKNSNDNFEFADEMTTEYINLMDKHMVSESSDHSYDNETDNIMINPDDI